MSVNGAKLTGGQGLFCAEISPDTERLEPSKAAKKNSAPRFEIDANRGAEILIRSNSVSSQNANQNLIAEILDGSALMCTSVSE
jgi:hypothetical protein